MRRMGLKKRPEWTKRRDEEVIAGVESEKTSGRLVEEYASM